MTEVASAPEVGPQHCPKCDATAAKAAVLTLAYVYLRCDSCGRIAIQKPAQPLSMGCVVQIFASSVSTRARVFTIDGLIG
jgi:hypothetical protein